MTGWAVAVHVVREIHDEWYVRWEIHLVDQRGHTISRLEDETNQGDAWNSACTYADRNGVPAMLMRRDEVIDEYVPRKRNRSRR